jgi:ABC-2 type transport system permease protein
MFFGFVAGLGLILSVFYVFFRDTSHIYSVFLLAWMYATPIIYPIEIVPEKYRILFEFNPLYFYISYNREIVINGTIPSLGLHAVCFCLSTVTLGIGLYLFKKNQDNFILYI